jgi:thiamine transport system permease protein
MAKRSRSLIPFWLWPGVIAAALIIGTALLSFFALWHYAPDDGGIKRSLSLFLQDGYLWHVIRFTFMQAVLSTLLSVIPAIFVAQALFRRRFVGRRLLLKLYAMTLVLPVLVAVFGLLAVYGKQGWLAQLCDWLNLDYAFSIYGLQGILLAHVFFNLPLASRLLLQALEAIAPEQRQLSAQLGMNAWQRFRFVEWPVLKRQLLPTSALIFMLCFASFAVVLSLGGGPKATTIELAVYQALRYDFDLSRAALLALTQMVCCLAIMLFSLRIHSPLPLANSYYGQWYNSGDSIGLKAFDGLIIIAAALFIVPPLLAVVIDGMNVSTIEVLSQTRLWQATLTSIEIALGAAVISVALTLMLLWSSRELSAIGQQRWATRLELSGMTILAMPALVLATGFFLLLINSIGIPQSPIFLITVINGLMAVPYTLKVLTQPMYALAQRYTLINRSLGISGLNRLRLIELSALKSPISQALAFACVLSIGDFGIIALFGNEHFITLPYYLYELLGAYRSQYGAVTALVLLVLCFLLFSVIERLSGRHDQP